MNYSNSLSLVFFKGRFRVQKAKKIVNYASMETVLVTGAFGFIGSSLTECLLKNGYRVIAADQPYDEMAALTKKRFDFFSQGFPEIELFDIRSLSSCRNAILKYSPLTVFHLAALPGIRSSFYAPRDYWETNLNGALNVIESAKDSNVRTVFLASSSSVYGSILKGQKSQESDRIDLPMSPYAATKSAMEMMASSLTPSLNLKVISLRFFTVFGPYGRPDMAVWKFTKALLLGEEITLNGDGSQLRDFTPIFELTTKLEKLLDLSKKDINLANVTAINLGSGHPSSILELVDSLSSRLRIIPRLNFGRSVLGDVFETRSHTSLQEKFGLTSLPSDAMTKGLDLWVEWALSNSDLIKSY
jgi:UDP-glucuronate 4-epimerase